MATEVIAMSAFSQPVSIELRDRIAVHVVRALEDPGFYPPRALAGKRAVLVYATETLYAYYLGEDGAVYVEDMDHMRGPEVTTSVSTIREVYERACADWPELAALLDIDIIDRVDPDVALAEGFDERVGIWNEKTEPREVAIARCTNHFARRMPDPGPAYVVQRLPSPPNTTFLTLEIVGFGMEVDLEFHITWLDKKRTVELLHRGTREAIAARLRAPDFIESLLALERAAK